MPAGSAGSEGQNDLSQLEKTHFPKLKEGSICMWLGVYCRHVDSNLGLTTGREGLLGSAAIGAYVSASCARHAA